jgi:hypothetical protein
VLRAWKIERKPVFVLLGLGSGDLAAELNRSLPEGVQFIVSDLTPENVLDLLRRERIPWWTGTGRTQLLADTSPWAHLYLWLLAGLSPDNVFIRINPELGAADVGYKRLRGSFIHSRMLEYPPGGRPGVSLSVSGILSPNDPALEEYFRQIPNYVNETVVVWDSRKPDAGGLEGGKRTLHLERPLDKDFAAQRNYMLKNCSSDWILSLDADERLPRTFWKSLPSLLRAAEASRLGALCLPRQTFFPDKSRCLAGYGLWPDVQLRLFRNVQGLHYVNPVHERLVGYLEPMALVLNGPILHYNRLFKSDREVEDKLAFYDEALGAIGRHRLNQDYPVLPVSFFPGLARGERLKAVIMPKGAGD